MDELGGDFRIYAEVGANFPRDVISRSTIVGTYRCQSGPHPFWNTADIRKTADVLGHSDLATTQKHYLSRGKPHQEIATMVNNTVRGKRKPTRKSPTRHSRALNTD